MMRFNHKRTTAATRVFTLVAVVVALLCFTFTTSAVDISWTEIQTGQGTNEYTSTIQLGQLDQDGNYKIEILPTNGEVSIDVNDGVDYGSLWATQNVDTPYDTITATGTPQQIYNTIANLCDPPISTQYNSSSTDIKFLNADYVLYEETEIRQESALGGLITTMFSAFSETIGGLADGVKGMFMALLFEDPTASVLVLSDFAKFGFLMMGLSMALGLGYFIIRKIRG